MREGERRQTRDGSEERKNEREKCVLLPCGQTVSLDKRTGEERDGVVDSILVHLRVEERREEKRRCNSVGSCS